MKKKLTSRCDLLSLVVKKWASSSYSYSWGCTTGKANLSNSISKQAVSFSSGLDPETNSQSLIRKHLHTGICMNLFLFKLYIQWSNMKNRYTLLYYAFFTLETKAVLMYCKIQLWRRSRDQWTFFAISKICYFHIRNNQCCKFTILMFSSISLQFRFIETKIKMHSCKT